MKLSHRVHLTQLCMAYVKCTGMCTYTNTNIVIHHLQTAHFTELYSHNSCLAMSGEHGFTIETWKRGRTDTTLVKSLEMKCADLTVLMRCDLVTPCVILLPTVSSIASLTIDHHTAKMTSVVMESGFVRGWVAPGASIAL